jgi:CO/xanthine dehydrogenase FAD-binding subunit
MLVIKNYRKVESLEEAWELNQKKTNRIIGGMLWLKMSSGRVQTAIDLSGLGLDTIEETEEEFRIGCMVTLRQLEHHEGLARYTEGAMCESVRHIVGVQFRNLATVGGSIFGRFGFSDVLTIFLAMDSYVELYRGGIVPMREFAQMKKDNDILVRVLVKKTPGHFCYQSVRNTTTDFPVLTCASSCMGGVLRAAVGARPGRAVLMEEQISGQGICEKENGNDPADGTNRNDDCQAAAERALAFADQASKQVVTGTNLRGSAEYRTHLVRVLVRRTCLELGGK